MNNTSLMETAETRGYNDNEDVNWVIEIIPSTGTIALTQVELGRALAGPDKSFYSWSETVESVSSFW